MVSRKGSGIAAILLIWLTVAGCAVTPTAVQNRVISEYMLMEAGFKKFDVNDTTPSRRALLDATGQGQIFSYWVGNDKYYVYADPNSQALYIGDERAYQNYVSKEKDKKLCQALDAPNSAPFWACYQEFQQGGKR